MRSCIFSIITPVFSVTWSSEIIIICWFTAQDTFLININVVNRLNCSECNQDTRTHNDLLSLPPLTAFCANSSFVFFCLTWKLISSYAEDGQRPLYTNKRSALASKNSRANRNAHESVSFQYEPWLYSCRKVSKPNLSVLDEAAIRKVTGLNNYYQ